MKVKLRAALATTGLVLASLFPVLPASAQGTDSAKLAQANNPLAAFNTFNLQNQYTGSLSGVNGSANSFFLRGALPVSAFGGDWLVRATLPNGGRRCAADLT